MSKVGGKAVPNTARKSQKVKLKAVVVGLWRLESRDIAGHEVGSDCPTPVITGSKCHHQRNFIGITLHVS